MVCLEATHRLPQQTLQELLICPVRWSLMTSYDIICKVISYDIVWSHDTGLVSREVAWAPDNMDTSTSSAPNVTNNRCYVNKTRHPGEAFLSLSSINATEGVHSKQPAVMVCIRSSDLLSTAQWVFSPSPQLSTQARMQRYAVGCGYRITTPTASVNLINPCTAGCSNSGPRVEPCDVW